DIAIELETSMTPSVMGLVTTQTGKLDALYIMDYPTDFKEWARTQGINAGDFADVQWDLVPYKQKLSLLSASGVQNKIEFFRNRSVPGLKYRDTTKITINAPTEFYGHRFES